MSTLQTRLETALKTSGKTRRDLMRACKATRQAVDKWFETEAKNLKMAHLFAVADECGVDARWLATGKGEPVPSSGSASPPNPAADIPQRRLDLIRMYGRLPEEVRLPIRQLIETLSWQHHPRKGEYVKRQKSKPLMVHEE